MSESDPRAPIVYTALIGGYEKLIEQPIFSESECRFICFTDDPTLMSATWDIRIVAPSIAWDPTRSARALKMNPPAEVRQAATSLWIDNRIILKVKPEEFVPGLLADVDLALPFHSFRSTVRAEFEAVLDHNFDRPERVREQLHYMELHAGSVLDERPYWTAILARRHGQAIDLAMSDWMNQVLRHSRRDQLSINWTLRNHALQVNGWDVDNFKSPFHEWAIVEKDVSILRDEAFRYSLTADVRDRWLASKFRRRAGSLIVRAMRAHSRTARRNM